MDHTQDPGMTPPSGYGPSQRHLLATDQKSEIDQEIQTRAISPDNHHDMGTQLPEDRVIVYLEGWRLHTLTVAFGGTC